MNFGDPWATFTQTTVPCGERRNEAAIILDYLDCDEAAGVAGLFVDIESDGADARFTVHRGPDADSYRLTSFSTLEGLGVYLDGYIAGQAAAE